MLDRRALLAAALGGTAAVFTDVPIQAATGGVRVDVSRLVQQGWGPNATLVKAELERELAGTGRAGSTLVVSVLRINMPSYSGGDAEETGGTTDGMESEARVIGADGRVLASYPIVSSSPASSGGAWFQPGFDARRLAALVRTNAAWIRRYIGE
ncbi:hypothetical protein [Bosea sp. BIWAKO-01]|uniref:hypothetical protein n=1 Tax=Bosea sp. BIWAKO-01 TaxID=506668 RepID=UPI000869D4B7|nr:hypothetical protein [Bosea sp. BIWAKO-01]GAU83696.1 hypothetical protein BIWAKO_03623 [Bosea sp. BIWAKO-01]